MEEATEENLTPTVTASQEFSFASLKMDKRQAKLGIFGPF